MKVGERKASAAWCINLFWKKKIKLENKRGGCRAVYGHCVCLYFYSQILIDECKIGIVVWL